MAYNHVKLDESILPKNLGKKGKNQNGIIMAADSPAVDFDLKGQMVGYGIMRLYQLTHSTQPSLPEEMLQGKTGQK